MRARRWGIAFLVLIGVLVGRGAPPPPPMARAQEDSRLYLPAVFRNHDPSYFPPFGITMYGNVDDAAGLPQMQAAGSRWVVTVLNWAAVEPQRGVRNWEVFDAKVRNAEAAGMRVFVLFHNNPPWAAPYPSGPVTDTQGLTDFLDAAAERYDGDGVDDAPGSPRVSAWSFYAEPDAGDPVRYPGKGHWGKQPEKYAEMLRAAAEAIRARDPGAWVMNGGIAYDWFEEEGGPFVRTFLTDTLRTLNTLGGGYGQARRFLSAVAFHFYPISAHRWPTIQEKAAEIRTIMANHGVGDLPVVVPEMGFWSDPAAGSSEIIQARELARMFVRGLAADLRLMAWLEVFDAGPGTEAHGLFRGRDLNDPKPAYFAYRAVTRELTGARYEGLFQASGVEGYVFRMPDGTKKTVLWAVGADTTVDFPASCLRLVDREGGVFDPVRDGDPNWDGDGQRNGVIRLGIYTDQVFYVSPKPCP